MSSRYPKRCSHNVILCDLCTEQTEMDGLRERSVALAREIAVMREERAKTILEVRTLRDRVRDLEQKLSEQVDENYDLKQQVRQLRSVNEELRALKGGSTRGPRTGGL